MGAPIHIVDARGKDTLPVAARAQDNFLHIDHTPFNAEFKVILTWTKGEASGPKGQNFVYLPGTNHAVRSFRSSHNGDKIWTENGSIFATAEALEEVLDFQTKTDLFDGPTIIEIQDFERPLTTIFEAGSLVHHGYRRNDGRARSSIIMTFHSNIENAHLRSFGSNCDVQDFDLWRYLFSPGEMPKVPAFVDVLVRQSTVIGAKLIEMEVGTGGTVYIDQNALKMSENDVNLWSAHVSAAPMIREIKRKDGAYLVDGKSNCSQFLKSVAISMWYDKHSPLDLALYPDNREEVRKLSRKRIREMSIADINGRLSKWASKVVQPRVGHVLSVSKLTEVAREVCDAINLHQCLSKSSADRQHYCSSLHRFALDIEESLKRCESLQNFLAGSLFLFFCCDDLLELEFSPTKKMLRSGAILLRHYIATSILQYEVDG